MKRFIVFSIFSILSFKIFSTLAFFPTGEFFVEKCRPGATGNVGVCRGYVAGVFDSMSDNMESHHGRKALNCWDKEYPGMTDMQLVKILYKFYQDNPKDLNYTPSSTLRFLIKKDFPLSKRCATFKPKIR